jgi:hypothetical protein
MKRRVWRYTVRVDGAAHVLLLPTNLGVYRPLHVASRRPHVVEFWIEAMEEYGRPTRHVLQVFATGADLPAEAEWRGTALAALGLVWHLYQLREPEAHDG